MIVTVNDKQVEVDATTTIADLLSALGYPDRGIAVALDYSVLPKADWHQTLSDGARLEILTAVQGG
ncbi:sulfur carrier protein ThiS [Mycobacterium sp. 1274756.6]|uniref:sulfur carrier protein ThiS n=1 Tax=Mycobacterium sp. 1274756.6 TaxID=1834076 RepID=UPI0007FF5C2A|nr:sulfur carrier protein ThiS [Mycobacterium sp. 1274756.6]OBJ69140.1 thiamine biosynthesis protein ThiS [Mycobacterium sp. 1274756.6]